jgi:acyl carrier protein
MYPYIITEQKVTVIIDGRIFSVYQDDDRDLYRKVIAAIHANDKETVLILSNPAKTVEDAVKGAIDITYEHGFIWYRGVQVNNYVVDKILALKKVGADVARLEKLLVNIYDNPNKEVIPFLYEFLEYGNLPITENGTFLAFKRVRSDYKDIHSGTFDNSPGVVVTEDRSVVNSDRNATCSRGLHFCSWEYLPHFGSRDAGSDRVLIVEINPKDVVMIPRDYNNTKARCCKYKVLYDYGKRWDDIQVEDLKTKLAVTAVDIAPKVVVSTPVAVQAKREKHSLFPHFAEVISFQLGVPMEDVKEDSNIYDDLGADSLDAVELVMALEEEFNVEIPDYEAEEFGKNETIGELIEVFAAKFYKYVDHLLTATERTNAVNFVQNKAKHVAQKLPVITAAPVAKQLPARGPDGRFLPKSVIAPVAKNQIGVVRKQAGSSQYWNGSEWKAHYAGVRMRNATGQFLAGQVLHSDGFFYIV